MKTRWLAALLALGMANTLFAQLDSEDLPPPEPVPMTEPIPVPESELNYQAVPASTQEGGEQTAYDFGVSYAPSASCLLYTSPSPRDQRGSRMPSSA